MHIFFNIHIQYHTIDGRRLVFLSYAAELSASERSGRLQSVRPEVKGGMLWVDRYYTTNIMVVLIFWLYLI